MEQVSVIRCHLSVLRSYLHFWSVLLLFRQICQVIQINICLFCTVDAVTVVMSWDVGWSSGSLQPFYRFLFGTIQIYPIFCQSNLIYNKPNSTANIEHTCNPSNIKHPKYTNQWMKYEIMKRQTLCGVSALLTNSTTGVPLCAETAEEEPGCWAESSRSQCPLKHTRPQFQPTAWSTRHSRS